MEELDVAEVETAGRYSIRAVARAIDILDILAVKNGGVSLAEVAREIGLPKSSTFRYLATLEARGYVIRDASEVFRASGGRSGMRPRDVARLTAVAAVRMQELSRRFDETVNLGVLDGHFVAYLQVVESPKAMRFAAAQGGTDPIHSSALGKAISAGMTDQLVREILAVEGMPALTQRTITRPADFLRELEQVRTQGYAVDDGENEEGGRCVAVAISYPARAAISVSAPAGRLPKEQLPEVAATIRRVADDIAQEMRNGA